MKSSKAKSSNQPLIILQPRIVHTSNRSELTNTECTYAKAASSYWGNALFIQTWKDLGLHQVMQSISYQVGVPKNFRAIIFLLVTQSIIDLDTQLGTLAAMSELVFDTNEITLRQISDSLDILDMRKDRIIQTIHKHLATMSHTVTKSLSSDITNWKVSPKQQELAIDEYIREHQGIKCLAQIILKVFQQQLQQAGIKLTTAKIVKVAQTRTVIPVIDPSTGMQFVDIQAYNSNVHGVNVVEDSFIKIANFLNYPHFYDLISKDSFQKHIAKFLVLDPKLYDNITPAPMQQDLITKAQSYRKLRTKK